jgi:hypothetical protein
MFSLHNIRNLGYQTKSDKNNVEKNVQEKGNDPSGHRIPKPGSNK